MRRRAATSSDVARLAGVSQATVSVVLSGRPSTIRVSDATRQRILAAAAELDYAPHPLARNLRRQRNGILAFIPRPHRATPDEHPGPFFLNAHVARVAMAHGYHVIELSSEAEAASSGEALVRSLHSRRVDGAILHKPDSAEKVRAVVESGLPVVQVMRPQPEVASSTVTIDLADGFQAAVDHLVEFGHRRIAFIDHNDPYAADDSRREHFRVALTRRGLVANEDLLRLETDGSLAQGYTATLDLLGLSEDPTALFAASGGLALGALRALYERAIRVPDELSVVSFDDAYAPYVYPPVTSVTPSLELVAEKAVELLVEELDRPETDPAAPTHVVLPTKLVVRESTARARLSLGFSEAS